MPAATPVIFTSYKNKTESIPVVVDNQVILTDSNGNFITSANPLPFVSVAENNNLEIISRQLDTNGDGSGTINANGNYAAPTRFYIQPAPGEIIYIARLIVTIEDTTGFQAEEYGNLGAALTNGITLQRSVNGVQTANYTPATIKTNADWGTYCYDVDLKSWGAGDEVILVRWTLQQSGVGVILNGDNLESLDIVLNDDLSGLITHFFVVQGHYIV